MDPNERVSLPYCGSVTRMDWQRVCNETTRHFFGEPNHRKPSSLSPRFSIAAIDPPSIAESKSQPSVSKKYSQTQHSYGRLSRPNAPGPEEQKAKFQRRLYYEQYMRNAMMRNTGHDSPNGMQSHCQKWVFEQEVPLRFEYPSFNSTVSCTRPSNLTNTGNISFKPLHGTHTINHNQYPEENGNMNNMRNIPLQMEPRPRVVICSCCSRCVLDSIYYRPHQNLSWSQQCVYAQYSNMKHYICRACANKVFSGLIPLSEVTCPICSDYLE